MVEWLQQTGYPLRRVHYEEWRAELIDLAATSEASTALAPLLHFLPRQETKKGDYDEQHQRESMGPLRVDCQNTRKGLSDSNIVCPPINDELLAVYFSFFLRGGLMPLPTRSIVYLS